MWGNFVAKNFLLGRGRSPKESGELKPENGEQLEPDSIPYLWE